MAARKIVERSIGDVNDSFPHKLRALRRALLRMLDAAFPLHHCPTRVVVLCHLAEYLPKIDLAIAERAKAPRSINPILVPSINSRPPTRSALLTVHMKPAHAIVIKIEKSQITQLLQLHVARVVQNVRARVVAHRA